MPESGRVSLMTAPGTAALAVVRLQGPAAAAFVRERFGSIPEMGLLKHGRWLINGEVLDDPLIVTGEGFIDIHLHGGRRIVEKFIENAKNAGFVVGEFVASDEVEAWLPQARTMAGLTLLLNQREALKTQPVDMERIRTDLTLRRLLVPARVAIVGAVNVGKSTLANHLSGTAGSLVADVPGTTRDWVDQPAVLTGDGGEVPVILSDTPGRREEADEIEAEAIRLSSHALFAAVVIVLVGDASRPNKLPGEFVDDPRTLLVWNKSDLAPPPPGLSISATTGLGISALEAAIIEKLGIDLSDLTRPCVWT